MKNHGRPFPRGRAKERTQGGADRAADPEDFAARALGFASVAADASSLIVLSDIGALAAARSVWRLRTIAAAAAEAGAAAAGVESLEIGEESGELSTDRALAAAAGKARLPLFSEDRKVLMDGEARGLDCFDALVAVEVLAAKGAMTRAAYEDARRRLLARNAYNEDRLAWARAVGAAAIKLA